MCGLYRQYTFVLKRELEAKCPHVWILNSSQNLMLNLLISQHLLTQVISLLFLTIDIMTALAFCSNFSLNMCREYTHVSACLFFFSAVLLNFFSKCILLTFWHSNHSAELDHFWSGPAGSDSCASEIRFLCVFICHCAFSRLFGQKEGVLTFPEVPERLKGNFKTSDRVMDEGSEGQCWTELSQSSS